MYVYYAAKLFLIYTPYVIYKYIVGALYIILLLMYMYGEETKLLRPNIFR